MSEATTSSQTPDDQERREFTRVPVQIDVDLVANDDGPAIFASTENVSLKGLFLQCRGDLPPGTPCRITLYLGGRSQEAKIEIEGEVVRRESGGVGIEVKGILGLQSFDHLQKLLLYNASEPGRVEGELESHLGVRPKSH